MFRLKCFFLPTAASTLRGCISPGMAMTLADIIADIDGRVNHINTQTEMGSIHSDVVNEQFQALLQQFSKMGSIDLKDVTTVSHHLKESGAWDYNQLSAFSACLRAAGLRTNRLNQSSRPMQKMYHCVYYFTAEDWDHMLAAGDDIATIQEIIAVRMHKWGLVCPDATTLKHASAIVQTCSKKRFADDDKRGMAKDIQQMLKQLELAEPWPFEYIHNYPRSPFELGQELLDHACGVGNKPVAPPGQMVDGAFKLAVRNTPYKKQKRLNQNDRLNQTNRLDQTLALCGTPSITHSIVPAPSPGMAASSGVGGGPFAAMMPAFMQAAFEHMGISTMPVAGPTLKFGPFNRKGSSLSVRTDATERDCPPTDIDPESEEDQLGEVEKDMAAAKAAVKGGKGKKTKKTSASDPAAPEPAGPKPKSKARKDRKATAKAKVLAAVAAKAAAKAPPKAKVLAAAKAAAKAPPKAKVKAVAKAAAAATTGGPIAKRPAASAPKLDKFNIETWMKNNATRAEAQKDEKRRYFTSRTHHRIQKAAKDAGVPAAIASQLRELACAKAGKLWDSVHPKKVG